MKFTLPMPPGINQTYGVNTSTRTTRHLFKKQSVREWENEATWAILAQKLKQKPTVLFGKVSMKILWLYRIERDIDAGLKILLDVFQKAGIYENDRQVKHLEMDIEKSNVSPTVEVELNEMA